MKIDIISAKKMAELRQAAIKQFKQDEVDQLVEKIRLAAGDGETKTRKLMEWLNLEEVGEIKEALEKQGYAVVVKQSSTYKHKQDIFVSWS